MNIQRFLILGILFISQPMVLICEDNHNDLLLHENFESDLDTGAAKNLLNHRHIKLVNGFGTNETKAIRVSYVGYEQGSERVVVRYPLAKAVTHATLSFDVCFGKDFQWTKGGKLHGLGPKRPITGGRQRLPDGWSARVNFKRDGKCSTYLYDQNMEKKYGIGGTSDDPVFTAGQWHHVTFEVKLNDPQKPNGFARISIDNKEVMVTKDVVYRGVGGEDTLMQTFLFSTFHGGSNSTWTPVDQNGNPTTVYAYFDNFVVVENIE